MENIPLKYPQVHNVRVRDSILVIARASYFMHLFVTFVYSVMLLILEPKIFVRFTLTGVIIVFYGLMLLEIFIFNFICVVLKKEVCAIWCNRFIAKLILMIFPILFLIAYFSDNFLHLRSIKVLMVYQLIISISIIIYEVYSCSWGHHQEPNFLYQPNDLSQHYDHVWEKRKEFKQHKDFLKKQSSVNSPAIQH